MNNTLKSSILKKNTILEFVVRMQLLVKKQREEEKQADFQCFDSKPKLKTRWIIEAYIAEKYTRTIFHQF